MVQNFNVSILSRFETFLRNWGLVVPPAEGEGLLPFNDRLLQLMTVLSTLQRPPSYEAVGCLLTATAPIPLVSAPNFLVFQWPVEVFDIGGCHAANSSAVVLPAAGIYFCYGRLVFESNADGDRGVLLSHTRASISLQTISRYGRPAEAFAFLNGQVGDVVGCAAYQNSGVELDLLGSPNLTDASMFAVIRI